VNFQIEFTRAPIVAPAREVSKEIGAQVDFWGIVREREQGRAIAGLCYEAHEPMARAMLAKILNELSALHDCDEVYFIHRLDFVAVGEASVLVRARARHRQAALRLTEELLNRLKADVPIWKQHVAPR
jgi:molybdopterin synthase catalytic subunit